MKYDDMRGRYRRDAPPRADYGQADYSRDYRYDPVRRTGYRAENLDDVARDDYGQADYSEDYGYDPVARRGYRRDAESERDTYYGRDVYGGDLRPPYDRQEPRAPYGPPEPRSWFGRAEPARRRGAPSDRVIWAVVTQRLANARGLDASHIEVEVRDAEVTLNGTVRHRDDKRRAEDLAEIDGVPHVQNNLRIHRGFHF